MIEDIYRFSIGSLLKSISSLINAIQTNTQTRGVEFAARACLDEPCGANMEYEFGDTYTMLSVAIHECFGDYAHAFEVEQHRPLSERFVGGIGNGMQAQPSAAERKIGSWEPSIGNRTPQSSRLPPSATPQLEVHEVLDIEKHCSASFQRQAYSSVCASCC